MPAYRCRAPGCGRFVSGEGATCARHQADSPAVTLDPEIMAIRKVLNDVEQFDDVELRAKLIPRIVSVSIQAIKTGHQLGNQAGSEILALLESVAPELEKNRHSERSDE